MKKDIIGNIENNFHNQKFYNKKDFFDIYIECKNDINSDFYSQILLSSQQEKPLFPVFENINCEYTIKESDKELINEALNQLEVILNFVENKNVYYLKSYYETLKETLSCGNELFSFIIDNEFTDIEKRIINTQLSFGNLENIISHNESILSIDEVNQLSELEKPLLNSINKAFLKSINKENKKSNLFGRIIKIIKK